MDLLCHQCPRVLGLDGDTGLSRELGEALACLVPLLHRVTMEGYHRIVHFLPHCAQVMERLAFSAPANDGGSLAQACICVYSQTQTEKN